MLYGRILAGAAVIYLAVKSGDKITLVNYDETSAIYISFKQKYGDAVHLLRKVWDSLKEIWANLRTSEIAA